MKRREFFGATAAAAAAAPVLKAAAMDVRSMKSRSVKVEIAYKSPHPAPNGLQKTQEGLWIVDDRTTDGANYVSLVNFADGKVIREFQVPGLSAPSGMTVDADGALWINSTHSGLIFKCGAQDGKILAKYSSPGTGAIYKLKGDPPAARSPLTPAFPPATPAAGRGGGGGRGQGLPPGQVPLTATNGPAGEGGQGMEYRDGLLHIAILPTRRLYVLDPKTWEVQAMWQLAGNRAHGVGWEDETLWVADTNWRAFFRHDRKTGEIIEKIQLTEKDPLIHGVTVHDGHLWYTDDVGYICNFKL
jgi:DNA-binding beta-propeller fold protein YncE